MPHVALDDKPGGQHRNDGVSGVQGLLGKDEEVDRMFRFMNMTSKLEPRNNCDDVCSWTSALVGVLWGILTPALVSDALLVL